MAGTTRLEPATSAVTGSVMWFNNNYNHAGTPNAAEVDELQYAATRLWERPVDPAGSTSVHLLEADVHYVAEPRRSRRQF